MAWLLSFLYTFPSSSSTLDINYQLSKEFIMVKNQHINQNEDTVNNFEGMKLGL